MVLRSVRPRFVEGDHREAVVLHEEEAVMSNEAEDPKVVAERVLEEGIVDQQAMVWADIESEQSDAKISTGGSDELEETNGGG
jgi:hypothetical protein